MKLAFTLIKLLSISSAFCLVPLFGYITYTLIPETPISPPSLSEYVYIFTKGTLKHTDQVTSKSSKDNPTTPLSTTCFLPSKPLNKPTSDNICHIFKAFKDPSNQQIELSLTYEQLITSTGDLSDEHYQIIALSSNLYKELLTSYNQDLTVTTNPLEKNLSNPTFSTKLHRLFDLIDKKNDSSTEVKSPLLLARVTEQGNLSSSFSNPYTCTSKQEATNFPCKVYKVKDKTTTNNLSTTDFKSLEQLSSKPPKDSYILIDLLTNKKTVEEVKNLKIDIYKPPTTTEALSNTNKLASTTIDQTLFGSITSLTNTHIFPISPQQTTYLVNKKTPVNTDNLLSPLTETSKNYKCRHTKDKYITFDDSCTLEALPTLSNDQKIHSYKQITEGPFTSLSNTDTTNITSYKLTFNQRKLFNFDFLTSIPKELEIDIVSNTTSDNKTLTLIPQQKLSQKTTKNKEDKEETSFSLTGVANHVIADLNNSLIQIPNPKDDTKHKCSFNTDLTDEFDCDIYKASEFKKETTALAFAAEKLSKASELIAVKEIVEEAKPNPTDKLLKNPTTNNQKELLEATNKVKEIMDQLKISEPTPLKLQIPINPTAVTITLPSTNKWANKKFTNIHIFLKEEKTIPKASDKPTTPLPPSVNTTNPWLYNIYTFKIRTLTGGTPSSQYILQPQDNS